MPKKKTNASNMFQKVIEKHVPSVDTIEHVPYNGTHKDELEHVPMTAATLEQPKTEGNVQQFKQYTKRGKKPAELAQCIAVFLAKLSQATTVETVKYLCEEEKSWFFDKYTAPSTRNTYMTSYRHAIQDCFADLGIPGNLKSERETTKGLVVQHVAMNYMIGLAEDYETTRTQTKSKTAEQRDHLTAFDMDAAIEATKAALQSDDWRELAAGLIMAVQSRPSDMLAAGKFKAVSQYQVEFTSKAKKRGAAVTGKVFTIVDSATFIDAFNRLRRYPDVLELKGKALTEVDSGRNSTLNRAINRIFKAVIPAPYGERDLSAKNLRAAGVNVNYHLHGRDNQSIGRFAELQLLHDNPGTAANYEDYYCTRNDKRVAEVGIRKDAPLSEKPKSVRKSSMTVDPQLVELLEEVAGKGTRSEQLERVIAAARRANDLQRKLEIAEAKNAELKLQLDIAKKPESQPQETTKVASEISPISEDDDVRKMSDEELAGNKKRGAAEERIRRTVDAIQSWNAGRELSEQIEINVGSLRKLAGASATKVGQWVKDHEAELKSYAEAQGHPFSSQSKFNRGKDLSVIKLAWNE